MAKAFEIQTVVEEAYSEETIVFHPAVLGPAISLILSKEEAGAIMSVLAFVGGDPLLTRRGLTDNVYYALHDSAVRSFTGDVEREGNRGIIFTKGY